MKLTKYKHFGRQFTHQLVNEMEKHKFVFG